MEQLIHLVMERTGLDEANARIAVNTVKEYLFARVPPISHGQFDRIFSGYSLEDSIKAQAQELGGEFKERASDLAVDLKSAFERAFGKLKKN